MSESPAQGGRHIYTVPSAMNGSAAGRGTKMETLSMKRLRVEYRALGPEVVSLSANTKLSPADASRQWSPCGGVLWDLNGI